MFLSKLFNNAIKDKNEVTVEIFGATDVGRRRPRNEDTFLFANFDNDNSTKESFTIKEQGFLMLVADGMGGAAAGEVASEMAAETIRKKLKEFPQAVTAEQKLKTAVSLSNQRIYEYAQEHIELKGMGTTVTAAYIQGAIAYIAQVGDSRAYLLRGGEIKQLTKDQSLAQYLFDLGQITKEKMRLMPQNVILQALGTEKGVDVALSKIQLCKNDMLLLCSDGLSNKVSNQEINEIVLTSSKPKNIVGRLINLANERGGEDNITVVIARFNGNAPEQSCKSQITQDLEMNHQAA